MDLWNNVFKELSNDKENLIWLKKANFVNFENNTLTLAFSSNFFISNFKQFYELKVINYYLETYDKKINIKFIENKKVKEVEDIIDLPVETKTTKSTKETVKNASTNERYTFDTFITSDFNEFPYRIALAIAMNPGFNANPFLIYGGVGVGKTHLLCSIANYIKKHDPSKKIIYITAETFTNEYVQAIVSKDITNFRFKYRKADVLLIDDIHFLQEKSGSLEELFHTFNELYEANKQLVFTCDRPIHEMVGVTDRIKNRFTRGITANLKMADFESRVAILLQRCKAQKKELSLEIINFIALNVQTNIRDLEACLTTILAYKTLQNTEITKEIAKELISTIIKFNTASKQDCSIDDIVKEVSEFFKVSILDIKSKKRKFLITQARQLCIYIAREITNCSLTEIGNYFERDHSTIIHSCKSISEKRVVNGELNENIITIISKFNK